MLKAIEIKKEPKRNQTAVVHYPSPWNRPRNNNDVDGPHDDLEDEVAQFEAQLRSPTTPVSAADSLYEESNIVGTSEPPKKKGTGAHSDMNEHFTKSTGKYGKITAKCNYKNVQGTSNWYYHMKDEHSSKLEDAVKSKPIPEAFLAKQKDEPQIMSKKETMRHTSNLAEWIVCTAKPIGTVDEPQFAKMINGLNPSYKVPCRQTIRKLILDGYKMKKMRIIEELAAVTSRFSLTTDMWKASARKQSYLAITLHWIDNEWKLRNVILDFRYIPKNHSGENMKNAVMETLRV
ncbi:hypothetical protein RvY_18266 [Ramazzottius varieornatus]|uniref:Uncharacterized protein n=1 Tax=Ramazzottius varieornatus TaxID=947166 RepID=A0A1D1W589_RAMVA|nr:hypothetical protein RvY_18266 [Ramazzottius varieornatus]